MITSINTPTYAHDLAQLLSGFAHFYHEGYTSVNYLDSSNNGEKSLIQDLGQSLYNLISPVGQNPVTFQFDLAGVCEESYQMNYLDAMDSLVEFEEMMLNLPGNNYDLSNHDYEVFIEFKNWLESNINLRYA